MKRRNKIVQEITRNVANVYSFYAIIAIEHGFSMQPFARSLGTWRMLMHEKPCLIPILASSLDMSSVGKDPTVLVCTSILSSKSNF